MQITFLKIISSTDLFLESSISGILSCEMIRECLVNNMIYNEMLLLTSRLLFGVLLISGGPFFGILIQKEYDRTR